MLLLIVVTDTFLLLKVLVDEEQTVVAGMVDELEAKEVEEEDFQV